MRQPPRVPTRSHRRPRTAATLVAALALALGALVPASAAPAPAARAGVAHELGGALPLAKKKLTRTPTPKIVGTARVGSTLTARPGTWAPAPVTLTYRWYRGSAAISGATRPTYKLTTADGGQRVSVRVTGTRTGYVRVTKVSAAVYVIRTLTATPVPTITGTPRVGRTLTAVPGSWQPGPVTFTYQWLRDNTPISGATRATYLATAGDVTHLLAVRVTGTKSGYAVVTRTSAQLRVTGTLTRTPVPTILGPATIGSTLSLEPGDWDIGVALSAQWLRDGAPIAGATDFWYTITDADAGARLSVRVTGSRAGYVPVTRTSSQTPPVSTIAVVTGVLTQDTTWSADTTPVVVISQLSVAQGATLTIEPGVVVKFSSLVNGDQSSGLVVDGDLRINGTQEHPVVLTVLEDDTAGGDTNNDGAASEPYYDADVHIEASGGVSIAHADMRWGRGVIVSGNPSATSITDSSFDLAGVSGGHVFIYDASTVTFERNTLRGYLSIDGAPTYTVRDNTFTRVTNGPVVAALDGLHPAWVSGNTATNDAVIDMGMGRLTEDWTISADEHLSYATAYVDIARGARMTVEPGVSLFTGTIRVAGAFIAQGTAAAPIALGTLEWVPEQCVGALGGATVVLEHVTMTGQPRCSDGGSVSSFDPDRPWQRDLSHDVRIASSTFAGTIVLIGEHLSVTGTRAEGRIELAATRDGGDGDVAASSNLVTHPEVGQPTYDVRGAVSDPSALAGNGATTPGTMSIEVTVHGDWTLPRVPGQNLAWSSVSVRMPEASGAEQVLTVVAGTIIPAGRLDSASGLILLDGTEQQPIWLTDVTITAHRGLLDPHAIRGNHVHLTGRSYIETWDSQVVFDNTTFNQTADPDHHPNEYGSTCIHAAGGVTGSFRGKLTGCDVGIHAEAGSTFDARNVDWGQGGPGPVGSGPLALGPVFVSPWVGYTAPSVPSHPAPVQPSTALTCAPQLLVTARGSGEVPGGPVDMATDPDLYDGLTYDPAKGGFGLDFRGMGMRLQELLTGETLVTDPWHVVNGSQDALLDTLTSAQRATMQVYALRYPATSVDVPMSAVQMSKTAPFIQVHPGRLGEYLVSILVGADSLTDLLTSQATRCPDQHFVLAGYSQGAMVVHMALSNLPADQLALLAPRIDGVVLLADPLRDPDDYLTELSTATSAGAGMVTGALQFPAVQSLVDVYLDAIGGQSMSLPYPHELTGRTVSICTSGDAVCDPTAGDLSDDARAAIHGYSSGQLPGWGRQIAQMFW